MTVSVNMHPKEHSNGKYTVTVTDNIIGGYDPHYVGRLIIAHAAFFKNWFYNGIEHPVSVSTHSNSVTLHFTYDIESPLSMTSLREHFRCTNGILTFDNIPPAGEYSDLYRELHGKLSDIKSINAKFGELGKISHDLAKMHNIQVLRGSLVTLRLEALNALNWKPETRVKYLLTNNGLIGMGIMASGLMNDHLDVLTM